MCALALALAPVPAFGDSLLSESPDAGAALESSLEATTAPPDEAEGLDLTADDDGSAWDDFLAWLLGLDGERSLTSGATGSPSAPVTLSVVAAPDGSGGVVPLPEEPSDVPPSLSAAIAAPEPGASLVGVGLAAAALWKQRRRARPSEVRAPR